MLYSRALIRLVNYNINREDYSRWKNINYCTLWDKLNYYHIIITNMDHNISKLNL